MQNNGNVEPDSLRARKKSRTRQEIADAAALLFAARGFDRVTMAEISRAANVSEQTVYNYFPTKESLVLDENEAFEARFVAMIRDRPKGTSLIEAVRAEAQLFLKQLERRPSGPHRPGGMPYLVAASPAIRRHWLAVAERHAHAVAHALVEESGGTLALPTAKILGLALTAVFSVILDEIGQAMVKGDDLKGVIKSLRAQVDDALDRIAAGIPFDGEKR
jgi:AcrR family transcriptional regulator